MFGYSGDYWIWDSIPAMNDGDHFPPDYSDYLEPKYADTYQWIADLVGKHKVAPPFDMRNQVGELTLTQTFQMIGGTLTAGGQAVAIANGKLRGDLIAFTAGGREYSGKVAGNHIEGVTSGDGKTVPFTADRAQ